MRFFGVVFAFLICGNSKGQPGWTIVDSLYGQLPSSFHVYKSDSPEGSKPNIMYYVSVKLDEPGLIFTTDTTSHRRLTPQQYFEKDDKPLLIVNAGFFSFADNRNLNVVVKDGRLVAMNDQILRGRGRDSGYYLVPFFGTFGIRKNRRADITWTYSDSLKRKLYASQVPVAFQRVKYPVFHKSELRKITGAHFSKWRVRSAVGGGPVLVQNGMVAISNEMERKFYGKAIEDRHPRTAIGYTPDNRLIVFVCEGRSDSAAGLTLPQVANIMKELGCFEALNLDGGGSSCLLVNGREVNTPSSKGLQRAVPSVFMIKRR